MFGLVDAARLDVGLGRLSQGALHDAVQVVGRDAKLVGIEVHPGLCGEMLVDQLLEAHHARLRVDRLLRLYGECPLQQHQDLIEQSPQEMDIPLVCNLNLDFDEKPDDFIVKRLVKNQIWGWAEMLVVGQTVEKMRVVEE